MNDLIEDKTAVPDTSARCTGFSLPWPGGEELTEIAEFFRSIGIVLQLAGIADGFLSFFFT